MKMRNKKNLSGGRGGGKKKKRRREDRLSSAAAEGQNVSVVDYNGCIAHKYNEILQCNSHKALGNNKKSARGRTVGWAGLGRERERV